MLFFLKRTLQHSSDDHAVPSRIVEVKPVIVNAPPVNVMIIPSNSKLLKDVYQFLSTHTGRFFNFNQSIPNNIINLETTTMLGTALKPLQHLRVLET